MLVEQDLTTMSIEELLELQNAVEQQRVQYDNTQMALKVFLNSAYGALGSIYFRWFDINNAEAITMSGQLSIQWIAVKVNDKLNKVVGTSNKDRVIASDTDSIYVCFDDVVKKKFGPDPDPVVVVKWLDKLCADVMEPFIERSYQELADHMHAYEQCMHMKREAIADAAFWTGKKRYAMNVWNSEGVQYEHPKVKIVGLEAIKSSTPTVCRDAIKEAIRVVLCEEESDLHRYVERFREEFDGSDVMGVAFPRGVTRVDGYTDRAGNFVKGTPIHVKAAVCYNRLLEKHDLVGPYEKIGNGDKFKFHYLRQPNPFGSNVVGCVDSMPEEFNVEPYLDRDLQFEKAFVQPVTTILNAVGWTIEEKSTLEDFFA